MCNTLYRCFRGLPPRIPRWPAAQRARCVCRWINAGRTRTVKKNNCHGAAWRATIRSAVPLAAAHHAALALPFRRHALSPRIRGQAITRRNMTFSSSYSPLPCRHKFGVDGGFCVVAFVRPGLRLVVTRSYLVLSWNGCRREQAAAACGGVALFRLPFLRMRFVLRCGFA
jgi:hypothetical protein